MLKQYQILFVVVALVAAAVVIYLFAGRQKKRTEALDLVAQRLRLSFSPDGDDVLMSALTSLHLFNRGHSKKLRNVMTGAIRDRQVRIFDYSYTIGHGRDRHTRRQTVIGFQVSSRLPAFSLQPERAWHKLEEWLGRTDINFDTHPDFSKKYLLRGSEEIAIRRLFGARALEFFEGHPGLSVEGDGNALIVYRARTLVRPDAMEPFIDEGLAAVGAFRDSMG
jgi:hypothetical protein